ncbi:unnamed protein product [Ectocarpus sp. 6 AP-2014]
MSAAPASSGGTEAGGGGGGENKGNRLAGETSPYLLQHAHNPVDWMPWGQEAFSRAKEEDKPIFLSVGYSTCHWCHVMERESFESQTVAKVLNENFVSIKASSILAPGVDREERPDVDQCFMTFVQATSGGGGWPMSVWLTPDLKPFVGATYFPEMRFVSILKTLADKWSSDREEVVKQGDHIVRLLQERLSETAAASGDSLAFLALDKSREAVREGVRVLDKGHDDVLGGWGGGRGGMKFPQPSRMNLLLRAHRLEGEGSALGARALAMVETTLKAMAKGGIYDHLFDGFARYSTDPRWHVPHFEKMLYDQSQLVTAYVEAFQVTGDTAYADVARGVLRYVLRDMTDEGGGFYSAEDADSLPFEGATEKKEGAFCVWTEPDLRRLLDGEEGVALPGEGGQTVPVSSLFCRVYGVRPEGNVDPAVDAHGELTSQNVLFKSETVRVAVEALGLTCSGEEAEAAMTAARATLVAARRKRPAPHLDDKVLTSWNGLMASGLRKGASQAFSSSPPSEESLAYLGAATKAAEFVQENLYRSGSGDGETAGTLLRSWRNGRASPVEGFADDYAFLIRGLIDLYEADPRRDNGWRWLRWARELQARSFMAAEMDEGFKCPSEAGGGYYSSRALESEGETKGDGETEGDSGSGVLPYRLRTDYDGAEPGAGSVAADNLLRLSGYFGGEEGKVLREKAAEQLAAAFALPETPQAYPELTASLVTALLGPKQVIISGDPAGAETQALVSAAQRSFSPNLVLIVEDSTTGDDRGEEEEAGDGKTGDMPPPLFREILEAYGGGYSAGEGGQAAAYVCFDNTCSAPAHTVEALEKLL